MKNIDFIMEQAKQILLLRDTGEEKVFNKDLLEKLIKELNN